MLNVDVKYLLRFFHWFFFLLAWHKCDFSVADKVFCLAMIILPCGPSYNQSLHLVQQSLEIDQSGVWGHQLSLVCITSFFMVCCQKNEELVWNWLWTSTGNALVGTVCNKSKWHKQSSRDKVQSIIMTMTVCFFYLEPLAPPLQCNFTVQLCEHWKVQFFRKIAVLFTLSP